MAFPLVVKVVAKPLLRLLRRKPPPGPPKPPPGPPKTKQNEQQNKTKRKTPFSASPGYKPPSPKSDVMSTSCGNIDCPEATSTKLTSIKV